ncbi:MAG TPA: hypothetical protein DCG37_07040 [Lachnospiraceae bacterium]|nr:hypothetical protein [Lachnospiraceae bacterium]
MTIQMVLAAGNNPNMRVAMMCFGVGVLLMFLGWIVWKNVKPQYIPGYKKAENEDTKTYCRLAGQAHMLGGAGLILFSLPLNEEDPNVIFVIAMCICCFVMLGLAVVRFRKAEKLRRR